MFGKNVIYFYEMKIILTRYMPVNPEILVRSRKYLNLSIEDASDILKVPKIKIQDWESGSKEPTFIQLANVANKYGQSVNIFYLKNFNFENFVADFRIRNQKKLQSSYYLKREYLSVRRWVDIFETLSNIQLTITETNLDKILREKIPYEKQVRSKDQLFNLIRKGIEDTFPILIFQTNQYSNLQREINGVCLTMSNLRNKAILINTNEQSVHSKAFTLLHELCHIILYSKEDTFLLSEETVEKKCNEFSSEFLLPDEVFQRETNDVNWDAQKIQEFSKKLNVSRPFFALKLFKHEKIQRAFYVSLKKQYEAEYQRSLRNNQGIDSNSGGSSQTHLYKIRNRLGRNYIRCIYNAYSDEQITMSKALGYLNVKAKYFEDLMDVVL